MVERDYQVIKIGGITGSEIPMAVELTESEAEDIASAYTDSDEKYLYLGREERRLAGEDLQDLDEVPRDRYEVRRMPTSLMRAEQVARLGYDPRCPNGDCD